jgi:hypothetical protein
MPTLMAFSMAFPPTFIGSRIRDEQELFLGFSTQKLPYLVKQTQLTMRAISKRCSAGEQSPERGA